MEIKKKGISDEQIDKKIESAIYDVPAPPPPLAYPTFLPWHNTLKFATFHTSIYLRLRKYNLKEYLYVTPYRPSVPNYTNMGQGKQIIEKVGVNENSSFLKCKI